MNERIKELRKQVAQSFDPMITHPDYSNEFDRRLAELIVKECAMVVNDNDFEGSSVGDSLLFGRFGVE